jgi:hypothetical protein
VATKLTTGGKDLEKSERGKNMTPRNGHNSYRYENSMAFRMSQAEHALQENEKLLDGLRLDKVAQDGINALVKEQLETLKQQHKRTDTEIEKITDSREGMLRVLNDRMSRIDESLDEKINHIDEALTKEMALLGEKFEKNLSGLSQQFTDFASANKTWLIGVMLTVIMAMLFIISSRFIP